MLFYEKKKLQVNITICFILVSANSKSMSVIQSISMNNH